MWDLHRDVHGNFYSRLHFGLRWLTVVFKCHWRSCFLQMSGRKTHLEEVQSPECSCRVIIRMWQVAFWRPEGRSSVLTTVVSCLQFKSDSAGLSACQCMINEVHFYNCSYSCSDSSPWCFSKRPTHNMCIRDVIFSIPLLL